MVSRPIGHFNIFSSQLPQFFQYSQLSNLPQARRPNEGYHGPPPREETIMGELIPRNYYDLASATKATRKRLALIEQEAIVRRAAIDAAARDAGHELEAAEALATGRALLRTKGAYDLAEYATHRATGLNQSIAHQSSGNPRLEQIHRSFEETAAVTVQQIIYNYGMGR
jgi:hypothetical protein